MGLIRHVDHRLCVGAARTVSQSNVGQYGHAEHEHAHGNGNGHEYGNEHEPSVSGWGGGRSSVAPSVMGMPNMQMGMGGMNMSMFPGAPGFGMGMASGGSVIGSGGSVMGGMGGGGGMGMGWPGGGMMFPPAPRSMYGGSVYAGSEVGGPSWGTRSAYGESSGAPRDRSSRVPRQSHVPPVPPLSAGAVKREGPRARTKTAPSGVGQGAAQGQGLKKRGEAQGLVGAVSPPSSWKGQ
ncbi:hypothetical protein BV25DRAFT_1413069 [Artomyces pyxidatus]|uniref:Uncharacterized protein n=1 Tax=Artomyces pyxidatus TaxID=48021 RepID=A0ACB8TE31_9AGAM|nr:hypothetical protein BV25DRAFT_1413069 [Artomyces pyxidatus]